MQNALIRVGICSCLLGNPVRYNGGHQHDRFITDTLGRFFEFVSEREKPMGHIG